MGTCHPMMALSGAKSEGLRKVAATITPGNLLNPQEGGRALQPADMGTRRLKYRGGRMRGVYTFYLCQSDLSCLQVKSSRV